ncbi:MAG: DUF6029 family protein [Chitinophagales bacterium]
MKKSLLLGIVVISVKMIFAQSSFSGDLQVNSEFYQRDSTIGATGTPHYDNLLSGGDAWLNTYFRNDQFGLEAGLRLDIFNNSNLHDPGTPFTDAGIGRWYISKTIDQLKITGGYIYEQFGTGLVYRSYEERPLGIDNALFGLEIEYNISENWNVKVLGGQMKNLFTRYDPVIKGANIEGMIPTKNKNILIAPGAALINRTIDQENMNIIVAQINGYELEDRFVPKYNMYAGSIYNTLTIKDISWYIEYAKKSHEAIKDIASQLVDEDGSVIYSSLSYSTSKIGNGFGLTGQIRVVDNWVMRVSPNETLLDGIMDYLPSLTKQNSLRLTARYQAVAQELGELAYQINGTYTPKKGYTINLNYSNVSNDSLQLFTEIFGDFEMRKPKYKLLLGGQYLTYNQEVFENHPDVPVVKTITPFAELTYKFDKKKSMRVELQYQNCEQDFGSWVYGLVEYNIAPKWSFALSDMWNYDPLKTEEALHYYSIFGGYTHKSSRFTLNYVKQIAGIVCTGGVCRYEPAFSGLKAGLITTF